MKEFSGTSKEKKAAGGDKEWPNQKNALSRREFIRAAGTAGVFGLVFAGKTKQAAAFLEQKLEEKNPEGTRVAIEIFYSPHATREDVKGLAQKMEKADVFALEMFGWDRELLDDLTAVSRGEETPQQFLKRYPKIEVTDAEKQFQPYQLTVLEALYKSGKVVTTFDIPREHPLYQEIEKSRETLDNISSTDSFEDLLRTQRERLKHFSALIEKREQYMLDEITAFREKLGKSAIESLVGKKQVKITFLLGAAHTSIYHHLKKSGGETSRGFPLMPYTLGEFTDEAMRRFLFKKEVGDELVARVLFWNLVKPYLLPGWEQETPSTQAQFRKIREAVSLFQLDEIRTIFEEVKRRLEKDPIPFLAFFDSRQFVLQKLKEKGIQIPIPKEKPRKKDKSDDPWAIG